MLLEKGGSIMSNQKENAVAQSDAGKLSEIAKGALVPPVDIYEDKDAVTLYADLPGVGKENLSLQIDKDTLQIYGKVLCTCSAEAGNTYAEFAFKDYYRAFTIGEEIDREKIAASMNNGVLKLVLPKSERVKPRKIDIKFA
jgi:HSP20 family protein